MTVIRRRVLISGIVQGVFFRASTRDAAQRVGVHGWVRNLPDGRVEAVFQGSPNQVAAAIEWCRRGPPGSRVERIEILEEEPSGQLSGFDVTHSRGRY
ncbi:MAG: acylphosphatase [Deltaproteobacteria bacterium]